MVLGSSGFPLFSVHPPLSLRLRLGDSRIQWGHGSEAVESDPYGAGGLVGHPASMGPESWTPVEHRRGDDCRADPDASMGPESWTPVEQASAQLAKRPIGASMGPESWTPVEPPAAAPVPIPWYFLQWGRSLGLRWNRGHRPNHGTRGSPSMGPESWTPVERLVLIPQQFVP